MSGEMVATGLYSSSGRHYREWGRCATFVGLDDPRCPAARCTLGSFLFRLADLPVDADDWCAGHLRPFLSFWLSSHEKLTCWRRPCQTVQCPSLARRTATLTRFLSRSSNACPILIGETFDTNVGVVDKRGEI